ncbi:ABC transporter permease [Pseudonocardia spinosispora]|uniref:ABC transporter permease n=1 Tax=Pseudonocardia spinosispora TaxID=103441 RepID=UPI00041EC357|nr:ABC transporter permease [Pseudonocardia spinosispora]
MTSISPPLLDKADPPITPPEPGPVPGRAWYRRLSLARWVSPLVLLVGWQVVSGSGLVSERKLPPPTAIWRAAVEVTRNGQLGDGLAVSLNRLLVGFVIGAVIGAALGVVAGLLRWGDSVVDPVMQMIRNVPLFGLIPLLILWFGVGELPKLVLIALAAALPIYLNVHTGMRDADPGLVEAATVLGYSRWQRLAHVVVPGAASYTLVGVRLGVASAWLALVVAETIAADSGIGFMINNARDFLRTDIVIVGLLVYALVGLLMDTVVRLIERRVLRWRVQ